MLKKFYEKNKFLKKYLFSPFAVNINPNYVSLVAFLCAIIAGVFFTKQYFILGGLFVFLNGYFDVLDGEIARLHKREDSFGELIDHFFDRISDIIILTCFVFAPFVELHLVFAVIVLMLLACYLGIEAQALVKKQNKEGWGRRANRNAIIVLMCLLMPLYTKSIVIGMHIIGIICLITIVERFYHIYKNLETQYD
ncbi:MAG: hypothetical protein B6U87_01355 [Candidatus Aenigmarchaeota archaeon ex4484_52]|nr:MAG: hypothetical protein B6U87_01355 [Candidatus Aenigmarchaeota archaeon ex4484_52]